MRCYICDFTTLDRKNFGPEYERASLEKDPQSSNRAVCSVCKSHEKEALQEFHYVPVE